jgi:hypothetical protein
MYTKISEGNCKELKSKFIKKYTNLTEEDLECSNGRQQEMLDNIKQKLGKTTGELREIILQL